MLGAATRLWFDFGNILPSEVWTHPCPGFRFTSSELMGDARLVTSATYGVLKTNSFRVK